MLLVVKRNLLLLFFLAVFILVIFSSRLPAEMVHQGGDFPVQIVADEIVRLGNSSIPRRCGFPNAGRKATAALRRPRRGRSLFHRHGKGPERWPKLGQS